MISCPFFMLLYQLQWVSCVCWHLGDSDHVHSLPSLPNTECELYTSAENIQHDISANIYSSSLGRMYVITIFLSLLLLLFLYSWYVLLRIVYILAFIQISQQDVSYLSFIVYIQLLICIIFQQVKLFNLVSFLFIYTLLGGLFLHQSILLPIHCVIL